MVRWKCIQNTVASQSLDMNLVMLNAFELELRLVGMVVELAEELLVSIVEYGLSGNGPSLEDRQPVWC